MALMLAACAGVAANEAAPRGAPAEADVVETLWRGEESGWVYLVEAEPTAGRLDHPARVDADWLRELLAGVEVEGEREDERSSPVFDEAQLDRLVPALVHGLARASPDQEVVFALAGGQGGFRILDPLVVTTGRVFVENGRLNVIFGLVDAPAEGTFGAEGQWPFTPGSRTGRVDDDEPQVRSLTWGSDPVREDWFAIAVEEGSGPLPPLAESSEDARPEAPSGPASQAEPDEGAPEPATAAPAGGQAGEQPAYGDIRERLEILKRLHEDGLITDREYEGKRKEILEQL